MIRYGCWSTVTPTSKRSTTCGCDDMRPAARASRRNRAWSRALSRRRFSTLMATSRPTESCVARYTVAYPPRAMTDKPDMPGTYGTGKAPGGVSVMSEKIRQDRARSSRHVGRVRDSFRRRRFDDRHCERVAQLLGRGPLADLLGRAGQQDRFLGRRLRLVAPVRRGVDPGRDHRREHAAAHILGG